MILVGTFRQEDLFVAQLMRRAILVIALAHRLVAQSECDRSSTLEPEERQTSASSCKTFVQEA